MLNLSFRIYTTLRIVKGRDQPLQKKTLLKNRTYSLTTITTTAALAITIIMALLEIIT